jgi:hypothetical protein
MLEECISSPITMDDIVCFAAIICQKYYVVVLAWKGVQDAQVGLLGLKDNLILDSVDNAAVFHCLFRCSDEDIVRLNYLKITKRIKSKYLYLISKHAQI